MESSLVNTSPLEEDSLTGSWLYALVHVQVLNYAETVDSIMNTLEYSDDERVILLTRVVHALQSSQLQSVRIQDHLTTLRRSDVSSALVRLQQLLDEARVLRDTIKETLDDRFRIKSIDAAELSVSQSRSAVARASHLPITRAMHLPLTGHAQ
jgi:hypothetical protein